MSRSPRTPSCSPTCWWRDERTSHHAGWIARFPLLAVEILSPSTRRVDLMLKHSRLEAAGCPSYWVIDPDDPSIIGWDLRRGAYTEIGKASGGDVFRADEPFSVEVVPAELVR